MGELNIDILCANTPQAKGRVERTHQTLQDRLVKELRLRNISDIGAANQYAPVYLAEYNQRFGREPASRHDAHRPLRAHDDLGEILRWKEKRRLTQNLTVHYNRVLYVVEDSLESRALRGKRVEVHETEDGTVRIRHGQTELAVTPIRKDGNVRQQDIEDNKHLAVILRRVQQAQLARDEDKLKRLRTRREKRLLLRSIEERIAPVSTS